MPSPSRKNPWSSPEWKALRDLVLKDYCEVCGSRSPPFTPHHEKPLPSYSSTRNHVASSLFSELLDKGEEGELWERFETLRLFLEQADFSKLRSESEKHLVEGKRVKFIVHLEEGKPKYEMKVTD